MRQAAEARKAREEERAAQAKATDAAAAPAEDPKSSPDSDA